jgi:uncharacterized protein
MVLEGVVTNVTAFGAFVDVGVHQDGLVHVSQLADRFVKEASEVVKVGDRIQVRVLEVDLVRKRISLSAKKGRAAEGGEARANNSGPRDQNRGQRPQQGRPQGGRPQQQQQPKDSGFKNNPFAAHFSRK